MKRIMGILAALVLVTVAAAGPEAGAGWFSLDGGNKSQRTEQEPLKHRYDRLPTLSFQTGILQKDSFRGWRLGENTKVILGPDCTVSVDGEERGTLSSGRRAVVVGSQIGDTIVASSIRVLLADWQISRYGGSESQITWSESDPTVGEGSAPN